MPTSPIRTFSSSSILQLKLNQRLWVRFFIQTRQLAQSIDDRCYGSPAAYAQAFETLAPLENHYPALQLDPLPSHAVLNEFAMEAAYRLTQAVFTTPMPVTDSLEFLSDETVEETNLLEPLQGIREVLFSGGENPPHDLPSEQFSEPFWESQFKFLEERTWIEFLIFIARTRFAQDKTVVLAVRAIAHLARGRTDLSAIYGNVRTEEEVQAAQRAWQSVNHNCASVGNWSQWENSAHDCLQSIGVHPMRATGLIRNFSAYVLGYAMEILFNTNPTIAADCGEKHEDWIEEFFRNGSMVHHERELGKSLAATPTAWPVVIAMKSTLRTPLDCQPLSLKILDSNPAGISLGTSTDSMRYAFFDGIDAHDPQSAIVIARQRLNTFLNGLTYTLGRNLDSLLSVEAFSQVKVGGNWDWMGSGENRPHPSRLIEERILKDWAEWTMQLLQLSKNNELATRVIEALRIFRNVQGARDNQEQFTELWLLADIFLQKTNSPEEDLPLYQLVYAPKNSPKVGNPNYITFQKRRWEKYRKDVKVFWKIRNHGGIHHGKYPRWEERSLRLWTRKLEDAATNALRYCLNRVLDKNPPESREECLKILRARFKGEGIL